MARMRLIEIIVMILVILFASIFLLLLYFDNTVYLNSDAHATVDFSDSIGSVILQYGANENGNYETFVREQEPGIYHQDVGSKWIRVWVASPTWRTSTIPLHNGKYNFTELDAFINKVLEIDATPFVVFAHEPDQVGEAHGEEPPVSDTSFANYVQKVVLHYKNACNNNLMQKPCDVNNWYFEIWNEPFTDSWWDTPVPRYSSLYNLVYEKIKSVVPGAKVGGFSMSYLEPKDKNRLKEFLLNSPVDFVSIHHYGNTGNNKASEHDKILSTKKLFYDSIREIRELIDEIKGKNNIQIINSEYNSDFTVEYMSKLDEGFTGSWLASALVWQVLSQDISIEMFYSGTSFSSYGGFGMWSQLEDKSFRLWPVYYVKSGFVTANPTGAKIYATDFNSNKIDLLATKSKNGKYITIVNKETGFINLSLYLPGSMDESLTDITTKEEYTISLEHVNIPMKGYQVRYLVMN